jgi:hypothetical protein
MDFWEKIKCKGWRSHIDEQNWLIWLWRQYWLDFGYKAIIRSKTDSGCGFKTILRSKTDLGCGFKTILRSKTDLGCGFKTILRSKTDLCCHYKARTLNHVTSHAILSLKIMYTHRNKNDLNLAVTSQISMLFN